MICPWCNDNHTVDRLCQRASKSLTRRSFCFLFGVGVVGLTIRPITNLHEWDLAANGDAYIHGVLRRYEMTFPIAWQTEASGLQIFNDVKKLIVMLQANKT